MGLPPSASARPVPWVPLLALVVVSFAIRLSAVAYWTGLGTPPKPGGDEAEYDACAWSLVQGHGYRGPSPDVVDEEGRVTIHPTAYRPPTSVFFYAGVYAVAGHSYLAAQFANATLASLTVLLVFLIGRRLFDTRTAWLAAGLYAFYPLALYYNLTLQSESLAAFLIALFVWLCLPLRDAGGTWWAAAAGLGLGALLLCKPGYVFLIPLLPFWALAVCRGDRRLWLRSAIIPVLAGLVVLPWTVRNYLELGHLIPFGTGGGSLLLQANNRIVVADSRYHGYAVWDTCLPEYAPLLRAPNDEYRRDEVAKKLAVQWLKDNPDKWFYLARGKFWRLWTPQYYGSGNRQLAIVVCSYYGVILFGFLSAVVPVTRRFVSERNPALIMLALILATTAMAVVFHGQHRYRFPIDSLCTIHAAAGFCWILNRVCGSEKSSGDRPRLTSGTIGILLVFAAVVAALALAIVVDEQRIHEYRMRIA
jgi:hypothetical protein